MNLGLNIPILQRINLLHIILRNEASFVLAVKDSNRIGNIYIQISRQTTFPIDLLSTLSGKLLIIDLLVLYHTGRRRTSVSDPHNNTIVRVQNARP